MANLLLSIGIASVFAQQALASTCIPHQFALEGVVVDYEKLTDEGRQDLARAQKEYAELLETVRKKKDTDNVFELSNAFVDSAALMFMLHKAMQPMKEIGLEKAIEKARKAGDKQKISRLTKKLSDFQAKLDNPAYEGMSESLENISEEGKGFKKWLSAFFKRRLEVFKAWVTELKGTKSVWGQAKEALFFSMKKIGFVSFIAMVPMGAYIWLSRTKEQQRLIELTGEQDKVMKQALLFEMFTSQKSFAELAATRAKLSPEKVCPPST